MRKIKGYILFGIIYSTLKYYGFELEDIKQVLLTVLNKIKQIKERRND